MNFFILSRTAYILIFLVSKHYILVHFQEHDSVFEIGSNVALESFRIEMEKSDPMISILWREKFIKYDFLVSSWGNLQVTLDSLLMRERPTSGQLPDCQPAAKDLTEASSASSIYLFFIINAYIKLNKFSL